MSINEIIKTHIPINKQTLPKINTNISHCQHKHYGYCSECKENKLIKCNAKLIFQKVEQVNTVKWHLHFKCANQHLVIRWVIIDYKSVTIGNTKN